MSKNNHPKNMPTVLLIFGATGDLMKKKIAPALYQLFIHNQLPKLFEIVGFSRRDITDVDYRAEVALMLNSHGIDVTSPKASQFLGRIRYLRGQFDNPADYQRLATSLGQKDGVWQVCLNKLLYLAVPPALYKTLFTHLASSGMAENCSDKVGWTRILVEKPFGSDLATAQELDTLLGKLFLEEQIFRIDHYLAKEIVQNILAFRFSNNLFEQSWNSDLIERIEVRFDETIGVEKRGSFYDKVGALRDVGQNHLLQLLALVTMENPGELTAKAVRTQRAEILEHLQKLESQQIVAKTVRGQYSDYRSISNVEPTSQTETFFRITTELKTTRWHGVKIRLEGGKRLDKARKEVVVIFRHPKPCICPPKLPHYQNRVVFQIEPTEQITIHFWAKKPGLAMAWEPRSFDFILRQNHQHERQIEPYEKLLLESISGDQLLYVSTREIQAMWSFIDPILEAWRTNQPPLRFYPADSHPDTVV